MIVPNNVFAEKLKAIDLDKPLLSVLAAIILLTILFAIKMETTGG